MTIQSFALLFILIISLLIFIFLYNRYDIEKQKKIQEAIRARNEELLRIKIEYKDALKSGDKKKALNLGRRYYSSLRDGKLTVYDESALTNDLATMDEKGI
jgi:hypothetical protein